MQSIKDFGLPAAMRETVEYDTASGSKVLFPIDNERAYNNVLSLIPADYASSSITSSLMNSFQTHFFMDKRPSKNGQQRIIFNIAEFLVKNEFPLSKFFLRTELPYNTWTASDFTQMETSFPQLTTWKTTNMIESFTTQSFGGSSETKQASFIITQDDLRTPETRALAEARMIMFINSFTYAITKMVHSAVSKITDTTSRIIFEDVRFKQATTLEDVFTMIRPQVWPCQKDQPSGWQTMKTILQTKLSKGGKLGTIMSSTIGKKVMLHQDPNLLDEALAGTDVVKKTNDPYDQAEDYKDNGNIGYISILTPPRLNHLNDKDNISSMQSKFKTCECMRTDFDQIARTDPEDYTKRLTSYEIPSYESEMEMFQPLTQKQVIENLLEFTGPCGFLNYPELEDLVSKKSLLDRNMSGDIYGENSKYSRFNGADVKKYPHSISTFMRQDDENIAVPCTVIGELPCFPMDMFKYSLATFKKRFFPDPDDFSANVESFFQFLPKCCVNFLKIIISQPSMQNEESRKIGKSVEQGNQIFQVTKESTEQNTQKKQKMSKEEQEEGKEVKGETEGEMEEEAEGEVEVEVGEEAKLKFENLKKNWKAKFDIMRKKAELAGKTEEEKETIIKNELREQLNVKISEFKDEQTDEKASEYIISAFFFYSEAGGEETRKSKDLKEKVEEILSIYEYGSLDFLVATIYLMLPLNSVLLAKLWDEDVFIPVGGVVTRFPVHLTEHIHGLAGGFSDYDKLGVINMFGNDTYAVEENMQRQIVVQGKRSVMVALARRENVATYYKAFGAGYIQGAGHEFFNKDINRSVTDDERGKMNYEIYNKMYSDKRENGLQERSLFAVSCSPASLWKQVENTVFDWRGPPRAENFFHLADKRSPVFKQKENFNPSVSGSNFFIKFIYERMRESDQLLIDLESTEDDAVKTSVGEQVYLNEETASSLQVLKYEEKSLTYVCSYMNYRCPTLVRGELKIIEKPSYTLLGRYYPGSKEVQSGAAHMEKPNYKSSTHLGII